MKLRGISIILLSRRMALLLLMAGVLAGCSTDGRRAPVVERSSEAPGKRVVTPSKIQQNRIPQDLHEQDVRPEVHVVQRGETLYSIAFNYGLDYRELAEYNGIQNPGVISVGQEIRLIPGGATTTARPIVAEGGVRSSGGYTGARVVPAERRPPEPLLKEQPKLVKYPYSEAALAQIDKVQQEPIKPVVAAVVSKVESKPEIKPEIKSGSSSDVASEDDEESGLEWIMPTKGNVIGEFSESGNRKGIDIAGKLGQPVIASAPGKVVYSGSGLRGYGKLVIIKHDNNYLSAYAHNDQVLVKEGQTVTRGQKIAEMGDTDADQVKLHFEVRYHGKPVDPAKYLPL